MSILSSVKVVWSRRFLPVWYFSDRLQICRNILNVFWVFTKPFWGFRIRCKNGSVWYLFFQCREINKSTNRNVCLDCRIIVLHLNKVLKIASRSKMNAKMIKWQEEPLIKNDQRRASKQGPENAAVKMVRVWVWVRARVRVVRTNWNGTDCKGTNC